MVNMPQDCHDGAPACRQAGLLLFPLVFCCIHNSSGTYLDLRACDCLTLLAGELELTFVGLHRLGVYGDAVSRVER